jgi:hypothetical protein
VYCASVDFVQESSVASSTAQLYLICICHYYFAPRSRAYACPKAGTQSGRGAVRRNSLVPVCAAANHSVKRPVNRHNIVPPFTICTIYTPSRINTFPGSNRRDDHPPSSDSLHRGGRSYTEPRWGPTRLSMDGDQRELRSPSIPILLLFPGVRARSAGEENRQNSQHHFRSIIIRLKVVRPA